MDRVVPHREVGIEQCPWNVRRHECECVRACTESASACVLSTEGEGREIERERESESESEGEGGRGMAGWKDGWMDGEGGRIRGRMDGWLAGCVRLRRYIDIGI